MTAGFVYPPPSDGKPFKLNMGLRSLEPENWLEGGTDLLEQLKERRDLARESKEIVYAQLDGYEEPIKELVNRVVTNLIDYHSDQYEASESQLVHKSTGFAAHLDSPDVLLEVASVIGEDLVLLARENDEWRIVAGAVLFPSRWKLSEKVGKGMDAVHIPVPGYTNALAPFMLATFDKIGRDRPVWRKNWSLHSTSDLHQPESIHREVEPSQYWWRTERQTLTRAMEGDFLFFTIRNRAEPLAWIKDDPQHAAAFAQTLETFLPETIEYKGLRTDHQRIIDYLRG